MAKLIKSLILFVFLSVSANADDTPMMKGWQESVIITRDLNVWENFMRDVGGWSVIHKGTLAKEWFDIWNVPEAHTSAETLVMGNEGTERGYFRFVKFDGPDAGMIRPNAQGWDTGGIFDLNLRVKDMDATYTALMNSGFLASSDPTTFTFGPFVVTEWLPVGPDGVRFAMIQRREPKLEGWPQMKKFSRAFNSTMTVPDMAAAKDFWFNVMGFKSYLSHTGTTKKGGPNVYGLPFEDVETIVRDVEILHPTGVNEGSIELLAFNGRTGRDMSGNTAAPKRGIYNLRFETHDLDTFVKHAKTKGAEVIGYKEKLPLPPYGTVKTVILKAPGGSHIEIYEVMSK